MADRRTWWAKLQRADRHVAEFVEQFEAAGNTVVPYEVETEVHAFSGGDMLQARAYVRGVYWDDVAAIVGDIVFNARCALDHLCVALSGNEEAMYPIIEDDVWATDTDPASGKDRNAPRRRRFNSYTKQMPPEAVRFIKEHQLALE